MRENEDLEMKFELTTEYVEHFGKKLFRIRALVDADILRKKKIFLRYPAMLRYQAMQINHQ